MIFFLLRLNTLNIVSRIEEAAQEDICVVLEGRKQVGKHKIFGVDRERKTRLCS
jgi:hypothetical protein